MSTPDPVAPSPPPPTGNGKKWLIGCAIALVVVVVLIIGAAVLIIYAAKRQVDAIAPDAKHLAEDVRRAANALQTAPPVAQDAAQVAQARSRVGRAAAAVAYAANQAAKPQDSCQAEAAKTALTVDAPWFAKLIDGLPDASAGTSWMRDPALFQATSSGDESQTFIALDQALAEAGAVAAIHSNTTGPATPQKFDGYVQVLSYPDAETLCTVALHAEGDSDSAFQANFWAAEEAALGK